MRVLAFDPGHTTGIAFVVDYQPKMVMIIDNHLLTDQYIVNLYELFLPDVVAIETAPNHVLADRLTKILVDQIDRNVQKTGCRVCRIPPGLWKPVSSKPDKSWAIHGADALGLALYTERVHHG